MKRLVVIILGMSSLLFAGCSMNDNAKDTNNNANQTSQSDSNSSLNNSTASNSKSDNESSNHSNTKSTQGIIPSEFVNVWYQKDHKLNIEPNKIHLTVVDGQSEITKDSAPIYLHVEKNPDQTYFLYENRNPNASGAEGGDKTAYWIAKMKIDGKIQDVLVSYTRMGYFNVSTKEPTTKDYSFQFNGGEDDDYSKHLGQRDLYNLQDSKYVKSIDDIDDASNNTKKDNDSNQTENYNNTNDDQQIAYKKVDQQLLNQQNNSDGNIIYVNFDHQTKVVTYKLSDHVSDDYKPHLSGLIPQTKTMMNQAGFKDVTVKILNSDGSQY